MMMLAAGMLYRFDVYLVGFRPGPGWVYFPSIAEMFVTLGLVAFELMAYLYVVKRFPIFGGIAHAERAQAMAA
jgi:Ni/Fe-hydrogenase subunit HybB-like protein